MARYIRRAPRLLYEDLYLNERVHLPSMIVESDIDPIDTGILDADGCAILRLPNPIGFTELGESD